MRSHPQRPLSQRSTPLFPQVSGGDSGACQGRAVPAGKRSRHLMQGYPVACLAGAHAPEETKSGDGEPPQRHGVTLLVRLDRLLRPCRLCRLTTCLGLRAPSPPPPRCCCCASGLICSADIAACR